MISDLPMPCLPINITFCCAGVSRSTSSNSLTSILMAIDRSPGNVPDETHCADDG